MADLIDRQAATGGATIRHGVIFKIIEAGNCVYCGKHINNSGHIFLCEECRKTKGVDTSTANEIKQENGVNVINPIEDEEEDETD